MLGAFLVLNRFVTVAYLLGVSGGFAIVCGIFALNGRKDRALVGRLRQRLVNLGISSALLVAVCVPILLRNWRAIHGYYVAGHAVGEEKYVRAALLGIHDLQGHLSFYPNSIMQDHLGNIFLCVSGIAIGCGLTTRLWAHWGRLWREKPPTRRDETFLLEIIFLVGAILGPLIVLTADISKSAVVGGIVGVPVALLVVAVAAVSAPAPSADEPLLLRRLWVACAVVTFALGLYNQLDQASHHRPHFSHREDLKRLDELDKAMVDLASENGWVRPGVSYDVITGWLNAGPPTISAFEQSSKLIEFEPTLGNGVLGVDRETAISLLKQSDFAVFTTLPKVGIYPFYQHIAAYWDELKLWADDNMIVARVVHFSNFAATLYVRPTAKILGLSGEWITSHGASIEAATSVLERFPMIRLSGPADYRSLLKTPAVEATIVAEGSLQTAPATFQRVENNYQILIDTSRLRFPPTNTIVEIQLTFDSFFVPSKKGRHDNRQLVVQAPSLVQLFRK